MHMRVDSSLPFEFDVIYISALNVV